MTPARSSRGDAGITTLRSPPPEEVRDFLFNSLIEEVGRRRTLSVTLPAPLAPAEALLQAMPHRPGLLWHPPSEPARSGIGTACHVEGHGPARISQILDQAFALFSRLTLRTFPSLPAPCDPGPPRLFGGLSFAPHPDGQDRAPPWEDFPDARFTLPRWCYGTAGGQAFLCLSVNSEVDLCPGWRDEIGAEYDAILHHLQRWTEPGPQDLAGPSIDVSELPPAAWSAQVNDILQVLDRDGHRLRKVVAARRSVVHLTRPIADTQVLWQLRLQQPGCTRFAFRQGGTTFLGATPELLVLRQGMQVWTEALAGSIDLGGAGDNQALRLLSSAKDRLEHRLVVGAICNGLRPLCAHLSETDGPQVRRLRHVLHLHTPITATLRHPVHVLSLVAALHPTPAVAGVPAAEAVRYIADHEPQERGWYSGPVGWFDGHGDGEFVVAIRSGVLAKRRAYLYAGAGIVTGSDPQAEYQETAIKQQAMLRALLPGGC